MKQVKNKLTHFRAQRVPINVSAIQENFEHKSISGNLNPFSLNHIIINTNKR